MQKVALRNPKLKLVNLLVSTRLEQQPTEPRTDFGSWDRNRYDNIGIDSPHCRFRRGRNKGVLSLKVTRGQWPYRLASYGKDLCEVISEFGCNVSKQLKVNK